MWKRLKRSQLQTRMANSPGAANYFQQPGTVASWWKPEALPAGLALHFEAQLDYPKSNYRWEEKTALDAGMGRGRIASLLSALGSHMYGLDLPMEMLQESLDAATEHGSEVYPIRGDVNRLPFPDGLFDCVICIETLMHVEDPRATLRELVRVVKPEGTLFLGADNRISIVALLRAMQGSQISLYKRLVLKSTAARIHWHYSTWTLNGWLQDAGATVRQSFGIGLLQPEAAICL